MSMNNIQPDHTLTDSCMNHAAMSTMDEEYNHAFLEMYDVEKFYADEHWQQRKQLTGSEQCLLVEQLQSLIENAPISSHIDPTQKILELEYHNLVKILEQIQEDMDQEIIHVITKNTMFENSRCI